MNGQQPSNLKAYKASETTGFISYEWLDSPDKRDCSKLSLNDSLFSKVRNRNRLKKDFNYLLKLLTGGIDQGSALKKLRIQSAPPTCFENYSYLKRICQRQNMITFKEFWRWYNNIYVVLTVEAMQKMKKCFQDKRTDMLKVGCTLPNFANMSLHKTTNHNFYQFFESDKILCEKNV